MRRVKDQFPQAPDGVLTFLTKVCIQSSHNLYQTIAEEHT